VIAEGKQFPKGCYVILHIGLGPSQAQTDSGQNLIVRDGERFGLRDDIWIERLDESAAKKHSASL
jgi:hypothetical protein